MTQSSSFFLGSISCVDVVGRDAGIIVHNVTTNDVKRLSAREGCETFVTDVRGKTLGHGWFFCVDDGDQACLRFVGAAGQAESICQHVDKYTIREDATPSVRDQQFRWWALGRDAMASVAAALSDQRTPRDAGEKQTDQTIAANNDPSSQSETRPRLSTGLVDGCQVDLYQTDFLGENTGLVAAQESQAGKFAGWLASQSWWTNVDPDRERQAFDRLRVDAGFPWYGIDLDASNLPQELDRDAAAISFTKGCYLGQETVARLDALGQVQRKLVTWAICDGLPATGDTLESDEKTVSRLTTVVPAPNGASTGWPNLDNQLSEIPGQLSAIAMGFARRSHFEPGTSAAGVATNDGAANSGGSFRGTVIR